MKKYLKKVGFSLILLLLTQVLMAQQISRGEYFIDTDPGIGNGTPINVTTPADSVNINFSVPTTALSSGFHNLFTRFKYNNGKWGLHEQRSFYIYSASVANTAQIVRAEYFFDTDPGVGNATGVNIAATDSANININIPVNTLSSGFHNLYVRFKYNNGKWSLHEGRPFYIIPQSALPNTAQIVRAEYFFDTDPGIGNGTPVTIAPPTDSANIALNVNATGLSTGSHILYVRFKYNDGKWGLHEGRNFTICSTVTPAAITPQGTSSICPGGNITLTANTGNGLTYQWQRDGVNISGATGSTYTASLAGVYNVIVTSNNCPSISNSVTIVISTPTATITPQSSTTICSGSSVVLSANTGNGLTYQWKLNGTNINGATSANYTASQAGSYTVVVTQGTCNATSSAVSVTVNPATVITTQPQGQTLCAGGTLSLSVSATGSGLTYQWYKNGNLISGATSSSFSISGVVTGDAGNYTVIVTGTCGTITSSTAIVSVGAALSITSQPQSQTVCEGSPLTVSVSANGSGITYQWRFNGTNISGATNSSYTINNPSSSNSGSYTVVLTNSCGTITSQTAQITVNPTTVITTQPQSQSTCTGGNVTFAVTGSGQNLTYQWFKGGSPINGATGSSYTINAATGADAGNYTVTISGTCGNTTSQVAVLSVSGSLSISQQPQSQTVCQGQPVTLSVTANGINTQYQWQLNGVNINGATNNTYIIGNANPTNTGSYNVNITSGCGNATSQTAVLTVNATTGTTINQSICSGNSFVFNGDVITTQGVYYDTLQAFNTCDSIITLNLTVNTPNAVVLQNGNNLSTGSFETYQWLLNGTAIVGAQNQNYTATQNGLYSVVVSDVNGCIDTSEAIIITVSIDENYFNNLIVYPNPASNNLFLRGENFTGDNLNVELRDITGRLISIKHIISKGTVNECIYINSICPGIYLLVVSNDKNQQKVFKISKTE